MPKSPDAFRTISEVAEWLGVQAHVLRFWESKFSQIKPIKRAGGRRYYRPSDMLLIGGIKKMLHDDGLTIKGVQKTLREQGTAYVADQSQPLDALTATVLDTSVAASPDTAAEGIPPQVDVSVEQQPEAVDSIDAGQAEPSPEQDLFADHQANEIPEAPEAEGAAPESDASSAPETEPESIALTEDESSPAAAASELTSPEETAAPDDVTVPDEISAAEDSTPATPPQEIDATDDSSPDESDTERDAAEQPLPSFRHRSSVVEDSEADGLAAQDAPASTQPEQIDPKPRVIEVASLVVEADMPAQATALTAVTRIRNLSSDQARDLKPLLEELSRLREQMVQPGQSTRAD